LPEALRAWFYPGDNFGQEFVYPKYRAGQLAETTLQPVLSGEIKPAATPEEMKKVEIVAVAPEKTTAVAPPVLAAPPVLKAEPVMPVPVPESATPPAPETPVKELPKTAGELPLLALTGAISLGIARLLKGGRRTF
jgi:hypothetical protein